MTIDIAQSDYEIVVEKPGWLVWEAYLDGRYTDRLWMRDATRSFALTKRGAISLVRKKHKKITHAQQLRVPL